MGFFKRTKLQRLTLTILALLLSYGCLNAQFFSLQTTYMRLVYYSKDHTYIVPHLSRCFENALSFHRRLFDYTPSEDVLVFLQDYDDYGYAGATSLPRNYMILGIEPYEYVYEVAPSNERFNWVMNHELMHVVATDKAAPSDRFFRNVFFGKVTPTNDNPLSMFYSFLTTPRKYSPRWYHEGIATFVETWMAGGIGRVLGPYDETAFRGMVYDSSYFYDFVGLESEGTTIDFQIGQNGYLYGTRFVSYLAYQYGPEKVLAWFNRSDSSKQYFQTQFENVYHTSLDDEWSRWIDWEHEWQRANLDSIRKFPVTPYRRLSPGSLGAISRAFFDPVGRNIYIGVNLPGQVCHIASLNIETGVETKLCDMPTPSLFNVAATAYDPSTGTFFFTTHNTKGWRHINSVNVKTGETKVLLENARIGDLAFNPVDKSLWGVQHHNGISRLVRVPPPYAYWNEILQLKYGLDLYDPDISPDGKYVVASMIEISGRQRLVRLDIAKLLEGNDAFEVLYEFENNAPENFTYSSDGKYLYGTTYYTGVSNVVRYDFENKKMEWISNCETGYFRPLPVSDDSLIAFMYTSKGFVPVMMGIQPTEDVTAIRYFGQQIVEKYPIVKSWKLNPPSPEFINIDSLITSSGDYNGLENIRLGSAYPVVEGYKSSTAVGMRFDLFDPLLLHALDATVSYTPNPTFPVSERFHGNLNYAYLQWKLAGAYNGANFYDLFGPTKTSRKGYSLSLRYEDILIEDKPRTMDYSVTAAGYWGLEQLPEFQNVSTSFDRFLTLGAKLNDSYLTRSLGAVDVEKGAKWTLTVFNTYVRTTLFPRIYGTFDYGIALPVNHSSLWFRSATGYARGDRLEPFANFFFGGFGNNWVDYANEKRYREYYSFPGVELNEIAGTTFGKLLVELNLPPIRFRRLGFPIAYCNWARIAVFSSAIVTNYDSRPDKTTAGNVGGQIDFKLVLFSNLESTLSFGYALAAELRQHHARELMVSLKILK